MALAAYLFLPDSCPEAAKRCAFIFVLAAGFWAFEIFPLHATSFLVVLMLIFFLARPGGVLQMDEKGYKMFLVPFASPVIMLFFGGFVLARAMQKHKVDVWIARKILAYFGTKPYFLMLGLMLTTSFLSMWISNTATCAIMMGIILPLVDKIPFDDPYRKAVILSIPFSANLGGMGTPIGSPPNAIALGALSNNHIFLSFIHWMLICIPLMIILIFIASFYLKYLFPSKKEIYDFFSIEEVKVTVEGKLVFVIAIFTILLFITSPIHGIPEPLTALLCAGILMATRMLNREDIKKLNWDVLILMWGGLALGEGVKETGLGDWIVGQPIFEHRGLILVLLFSFLGFSLSLFISNTAAAALLMPIALGIHMADKTVLAITIAISCSIAMIFPISTPPNAIAYASGKISNRDMVFAGSFIAITSLVIMLVGYQVVIPFVLGVLQK